MLKVQPVPSYIELLFMLINRASFIRGVNAEVGPIKLHVMDEMGGLSYGFVRFSRESDNEEPLNSDLIFLQKPDRVFDRANGLPFANRFEYRTRPGFNPHPHLDASAVPHLLNHFNVPFDEHIGTDKTAPLNSPRLYGIEYVVQPVPICDEYIVKELEPIVSVHIMQFLQFLYHHLCGMENYFPGGLAAKSAVVGASP